jgi:hypothetical protein
MATKPDFAALERQKIEGYLESKRVKYTFATIPMDQFDVDKSLRNQARFNPINPTTVENYTAAMGRGEVFPPVVARKSGARYVIIDGNHRLQAFIQNSLDVPTLIVEASAETMIVMTYEMNTKHGLPTTEEERLAQAVWLINEGASQRAAAQVVGVSEPAVKTAWDRHRVEARAHDNGLDTSPEWKALNSSSRSRLGNLFSDEAFKEAVIFAVQGGLTTVEIQEFVTEVNKFKSVAKQLQTIEAWKERMTDRIQSTGGGVMVKRRARGPKSTWRLIIGTVEKLDIDSLPELFDETEREEARERCIQAADRLLAIAERLNGE